MMLRDVTQNGIRITGMLTNIAMAILSTFHLNLSFFIFGTHTTVIQGPCCYMFSHQENKPGSTREAFWMLRQMGRTDITLKCMKLKQHTISSCH